VRGTVIREEVKTPTYTLKLSGPHPVPAEVDVGGPEPLLESLRPGDTVAVTLWRDYAPTVSRNGVAQATNDTPVGEPQFVTAFALGMLSAGLFALYAGVTASGRARRHAVRGLPASLVTRGKQAFAASLCALPAGMVGTVTGPLWVVVLWAVLSGLAWFLVERLEARSGGRHARVPG
jgi:hypothetical protein